MKGIYDCKIIAQSEVGPGVVRTLLSGPEIARQSTAGQFVNVRVAETTDPLLRRPFSIHAVYPEEGLFSLLYVLRGRGTALLNKMRPGEKMSVVGPLGRGFDLGDSPETEHVVVAGGCGAAPLHFLCDALCAKWGCQTTTVLAGAQRKEGVLCEEEFRSHGVEVEISTDDGSYGYHGFVTQLLEKYLRERTGFPHPNPLPQGRGSWNSSLLLWTQRNDEGSRPNLARGRRGALPGVAGEQYVLRNRRMHGLRAEDQGRCAGR